MSLDTRYNVSLDTRYIVSLDTRYNVSLDTRYNVSLDTRYKEDRRLPRPRLLGPPKEAQAPIPAAKTGTILYHPRLENAEWVSTKQHQNGVSRAQPTGDQNNSAPIKQQGPDLGQNGL